MLFIFDMSETLGAHMKINKSVFYEIGVFV
jgi:hypothetical protein